jgi:YHS domain-containing protein
MTVDKTTAIHADRDGKTFYFCSDHCRQKFLATPAGAKPTPMNPYPKFAAMIVTSTVVMFGLMYLNTYALDHIFFSETRAYMALVMGATMAVVMLGFMLKMYHNRKANIGIFVGSTVVFAVSLWLVRSQATVEDVSWMKAMIPHHSIAILTSERARISDPRVRQLADDIIEAQRKEIAEMKALIEDIEKKR